jgi:hypothetical protein
LSNDCRFKPGLRKYIEIDVNLLAASYNSGRSTKEVAEQFNLSMSLVRARLLEHGVTLRTRLEAARLTGPKHSQQNKGRVTSEQTKLKQSLSRKQRAKGIYVTQGYLALTMGTDKGRKIHDIIMERIIGRPLVYPDEVVHHIDGNRQNNEPSNLQLMSRGEHTSLHARQLRERGLHRRGSPRKKHTQLCPI